MDTAQESAPQPVLRARQLVLKADAAPLDFDLWPNRILGVAGLEGQGQVEMLEVLCGLRAPVGGTLEINGRSLGARGVRSLQNAQRSGIAYLPRNRATEGILPTLSVLENFAIATLSRESRFGVLRPRRIRAR